MRHSPYTKREKEINAKKTHMQKTFEEVVRGFPLPEGIRRSQATTMARTVLKKGITNEIEIAVERDSKGWKRKLVFALTGESISETITKREPRFMNNTPDVELHWTEQQRVKNLVVSNSKDDTNQLVQEMKDKKHIRDYVRYLSDYSEDTKVKTKAGQILGRAESEMRNEYLETLKERKTKQPKQTSTANDENSSVEQSVLLQCAACKIIRREDEAIESLRQEEKVELESYEKKSIAGALRGSYSDDMRFAVFGTYRPVDLKNNRHAAIVDYLRDRQRNSTSEKVKMNAKALLTEIGAL